MTNHISSRKRNTGEVPASIGIIQRSKEKSFEVFDNLPPEIRAILRDAPHNANFRSANPLYLPTAETLRKNLKEQSRAIILANYGPDHPALAV